MHRGGEQFQPCRRFHVTKKTPMYCILDGKIKVITWQKLRGTIKKLPGSGISTPMPLFCLMCTIHSELTKAQLGFVLIMTEPGSTSPGFQWTGSLATPDGFQKAFRAGSTMTSTPRNALQRRAICGPAAKQWNRVPESLKTVQETHTVWFRVVETGK